MVQSHAEARMKRATEGRARPRSGTGVRASGVAVRLPRVRAQAMLAATVSVVQRGETACEEVVQGVRGRQACARAGAARVLGVLAWTQLLQSRLEHRPGRGWTQRGAVAEERAQRVSTAPS